MRFLFPFSIIPQGCRIIIYGAGEVGYDFYRQIKTSKYAEVVLWVDRQYEWFRRLNLPVDEPQKILNAEYDYIVITAENEQVYKSIRKDLIDMSVSEDRFIWSEDYSIHENIVYGYKDRNIEKEMKSAQKTDASFFFKETRLDIVIRYLYASELLAGTCDGNGERLYRQFILSGCDAKEPTENYISAYFSEYSNKRGIKAFQESFRKLVNSMNTDGFIKEQFVPVDSNGNLINGAHRVAAALACHKDVWYASYPFNGLRYICDEVTLSDMGFENDDIRNIVACYEKIKHSDKLR